MRRDKDPEPEIIAAKQGSGALCAEAQADGVPCFEVGKDCAVCDHAFHHRSPGPGDKKSK